MKYKFKIDQNREIAFSSSHLLDADVAEVSPKEIHLLQQKKGYLVELIDIDLITKKLNLKVNGIRHRVGILDETDQMVESLGMSTKKERHSGEIAAPMPGKVLSIEIQPGQTVEEGSPLMVLEAMKMENILKSPVNGTIQEVHIQTGDTVDKGQLLIKIV